MRAKLEIAAVLATGLLQIVFESGLALKPWFMGTAAVGWIGYAIARARREPEARHRWGLRADNFGPAARQALLVLPLLAGPMAAWGAWKGTLAPPPTAWIVFLAYPLWGLAQQWLLQGLLAADLRELGVGRAATVALCTLCFGMAHAPDWDLSALSAAGGLVWTLLFLRVPNLWVTALLHGLCGSLAFTWVLGIDPLAHAPWTR